MRRTTTTIATGVLVCLVSLPSWGLGFARLINATTLGQPLDVTIELASDPTEFLAADCVSAEVIAGESTVAPQAVRSRLTTSPTNGARAIRVTTIDTIQEPVVTLTVFAGCPTRVSRQFVVFVDPPTVPLEISASTNGAFDRNGTPAEPRPSQPASTDAGGSAPSNELLASPVPAAAAPAPASAPASIAERSATKPKPRREASVPSGAPSESTPKLVSPGQRAASRVADKPPRERTAPRLELERAPPVTRTAPPAPANAASASAAALAAAQSAAASAAEESKRAADAQRESIVALQRRLEKLQAESEATNKGIAQLQARLKQAEAERELGPLEYGLIFGGGLLLLMLGLFLGRRSAGAAGTPWWNAAGSAASTGGVLGGEIALDEADASVSAEPRSSSVAGGTRVSAADTVASIAAVPGPGRMAADPAPVIAEKHMAPAPVDPSSAEPVQPVDNVPAEDGSAALLTADQLIDLEQQAEFFIVLGQDDSAIDLLNARLLTAVGQSPLPLLKLLQIHRRRGERDAFDRARDRFERRFGDGAPVWEDGTTSGPSLETHDDVVARITAVWPIPEEALPLIESFLVHRERSAAPLRLGALSELQFLYLLARSLRDEGGNLDASVDLLLPINSRNETTVVLASPLKGRASSDSRVERIDVELDFDAPTPPKAPS